MAMTPRTNLEAVSSESRSDAVVVSFDSQWYEKLCSKQFTCVIRKRVPMSSTPRWLYFHINSPKSAICARAEILSISHVELSEAIALADQLALTEAEISAYFHGKEQVGCYRLGTIKFAAKEVKAAELNRMMGFHPPQSFCFLANAAKAVVDRLCGFLEHEE